MRLVPSNENKNQNKKKKQELRRLVLMQLSKIRRKMKREHPGMLEGLRDTIEANKTVTKSAKPTAQKTEEKSELVIDQAKNVETIQKMLDLKGESPGFERAVKALLLKQQN